MLFTSYEFIGFAAILFLLYYLLPKKAQQPLLLLASIVFYLTAGPKMILFLAVTIVTIWAGALWIDKAGEEASAKAKALPRIADRAEKKAIKKAGEKKKARILALTVLINVGILAVLKYSGLFVSGFHAAFHLFSEDTVSAFTRIAVPMGISFYTLQSVGYLVDVKRGTVKAQKNPLKLALFISFFPVIVQGPISNYKFLSETLYKPHDFDPKTVRYGLQRMLWGYFKKLVVADRLSAGVLTLVGDPGRYRGAYAFFLIFLYTAQLYADFTGGIDITIGTAEVLGIRLQENFVRPYFSTSLKEYWRRWHITMCDWFRTYVFYPVSISGWMGKVKKFCTAHIGKGAGKKIPVYLSSFIVWALTGLWHGASMNFFVWGLLNWFILMVSEECEPLYSRFHEKHPGASGRGYQVFQMIRTFLLISVLNLFDCFTNVGDTLGLIGSVFVTPNYRALVDGSLLTIGLSGADYIVALCGIGIMFAVSCLSVKESVRDRMAKKSFAFQATVWSALFIAVIIFGSYGVGYDASQFIYNRF